MIDILFAVEWLPLIIGAVLAYFLGWIWYSPKVFGKVWAEGSGIKPDGGFPVKPMVIQALGTLGLAWVVAVVFATFEGVEGDNGMPLVELIVLTIVFLMWSGGLFSRKKGVVIAVEVGYVIAMAVVIVVCHMILWAIQG